MTLWASLTGVAVLGLLMAEWADFRIGRWIAKPLASAGFVAAALAGGVWGSAAGRCFLAGFVLSWLGDVLLIPKGKIFFKAGLGTFLLGHVAFAVAFWVWGVDPIAANLAFVALLAAGVPILRWLMPHVKRDMRVPVLAYVGVISVMVALAAGSAAVGVGTSGLDSRRGLALVGAVAFYLSDLSVARDRFVAPGFGNRLWGLPLYYAAQLALAAAA